MRSPARKRTSTAAWSGWRRCCASQHRRRPAYDSQTRATAQWLADELAGLGFQVPPGRDRRQALRASLTTKLRAVARTLYYGHYDVQPADPLDLWESPPFEPTIVDGPRGKRIVARGAVDDKGQLMTFIEAFRAWKAAMAPCRSRSPSCSKARRKSSSSHLEPFLDQNRAELGADVCVISDTGMLEIDKPAITYMLRGMLYVELTLTARATTCLRHVWRGGHQPRSTRWPGSSRPCTTRTAGADPGLLRRCARDRRGRGRSLARDRRLRGGLPGDGGPAHARGRDGPHPPRAHLVAPDLRHQRHLGRLHRGGARRP